MAKYHAWIVVFLWICSGLHLSAQTPDPETSPEVDSLCRSALALSDQGQFDPALALIAQAMDHAVQGKDTAFAELAVCWLNKGRIQTRQRDYPGAEQCFLEARALALKSWGPNHPGYAQCLVDLGIFYNDLGRLNEAEPLLLEALPIWERSLGKAHVDYAWMMNNMGHLYFDMARYEEATAHYEEARSIREQTIGTAHPVYAGSLINLGMVYWKTGQMARAESSYLAARAIFEDELQDTGHRFYRNCLNNLSMVYNAQGKYEESSKLYILVLDLIEKSKGRNNQDYATSLNNLGNLYYELGKLELARTCYVESLQIRRSLLGEDHPQVASTLSNLAALYDELGQYQDVESTMQEALRIRAKALGTEHPDYAQSLSNLARFYELTGNLDKAEGLYRQVLAIMEKSFGKAHLSYAATLQNLANLNLKWQKFDRAEQLYLETIDILAGISGTDHPDYASALLNVGLVCLATGRVQKAETLLQQVRTILEASIGQDHPEYARTIANLGEVAIIQGDLETGEQYLQRSKTIWQDLYGLQHKDVTDALGRLAWVHEQQGRSQDAEQDLGLLLDQVQSTLSTATTYLPEQELQAYVRTFREIGDQIGECVQDRYARMEKVGKLPGLLYNYMLFHKGFLLNSAMRLKNLSDHTPASREIDLRLKSCRRRLARQYALPLADRRGVAELEEQARRAEKELIQSVAGFAEASRQPDWTDIRNMLKADQAAIEFMQYTRQADTPESSVEYAAIIIRPDRDQPEFVHLFSETEMGRLLQTDTDRRSDYVNDLYAWADRGLIADEEPLPTLYQLVWARIAATGLTDIRTIYYAPTGVLHRLNLGAIAVSDEQVLSDVYHLIEISSTRRLIEDTGISDRLGNRKGVVFGGLYFDPDTLAGQPLATPGNDLLASRGQVNTDQAGKASRTGSWSYLKWTEKEASAIKGILEESGIQCRELDGYAGTEEAFKQICSEGASPVVVHMATHGYFFPDPGVQDDHAQDLAFYGSDNPMIRSGLILAGGNQAWRNGHPLEAGQEDGILTAYEIRQMDLSNTELVVLSACETGLGDIDGNEGVYGLQRAFKIAGAKYLIMSLWQVPDRETMQFMTTFYRNWLEPADGKQATIPDAFRKTQLEMRDRFFNPYSWAGFVLVE